jgi:protein TonB
VEPVYSSQAKLLRLEGPVQVSAVIGQDGRPKDLKVVHGNMILGQLALNAIQQWRYKPSTLHGVPIEQPADITVIFRYVQ